MRKLFGIWMLLGALCAFTACSDDDDDKQPSGEVTILPKKVEKIVILEEGDTHSAVTYTYKYDNGKVTEITCSSENDNNYNCQYKDGKVTITGTLNGSIEIKEGKAATMKTADDFLSEENTFQYTPAGYLKEITTKWTEDGESYTETETFTIDNGSITAYREKEDGEEITSIDYEYGDYTHLNNLNIDLWGILADCLQGTDVGETFAFGLIGNRAKYLPVRLHEKDIEGEEIDEFYLDFEYKMAGEYITNIKLIDKEGEFPVDWEIQIYYEQ